MSEQDIPYFKQSAAERQIFDEAYNRTVDKFNGYAKIAKLTPTLVAGAAVVGLLAGWKAKQVWEDCKPYIF